LRQYSFTKKIQGQTVSGEKLRKTLLHKKAACKMSAKLTPGDPNVYCFVPFEGPVSPADIGGDANSVPLHRLGDRDMAAEGSI